MALNCVPEQSVAKQLLPLLQASAVLPKAALQAVFLMTAFQLVATPTPKLCMIRNAAGVKDLLDSLCPHSFSLPRIGPILNLIYGKLKEVFIPVPMSVECQNA